MTDGKEKKAPNWVANMASCTIQGAFDELIKRVQYDLEQANLRPEVTRGRKFDTEIRNRYSAKIYAFRENPSNRDSYEVLFYRNSKTISFRKGEEGEEVHIFPRWCDEKEICEYFIGDSPFKIWQISKRALCELFFGEI